MNIYITTLGCKLNYFESQAISESFQSQGYTVVQDINLADTVVVNTCTVTNKADAKSRQAMRKAKKLGKFVIATGCYAVTDFDTLNNFEFTDMVVGNAKKYQIPALLKHTNIENDTNDFPAVTGFERTRGFVKIQDGCNKFCSYCKIPFARDRSRSLSPEKIKQLISKLIAADYKEIVLTGVNISDYHHSRLSLAGLVREVLTIDGEWRLRLSSLQPDEFETELINMLNHRRFTPHFHLSLQSGSDGVLQRMNRNYTAKYFLDIVNKIRSKKNDCGITTDIIVGFPEESEKEFQETLDLVSNSHFMRTHIFTYSQRQGTRAAKMPDMNGDIKRQREKKLKSLASQTAMDFIKSKVIGREYNVLIETIADGKAVGYTPNYIKISTDANGLTENSFVVMKAQSCFVDKDGTVELET